MLSKRIEFKEGQAISFDIEKGQRYGHYIGIITKTNPKRAKIKVYDPKPNYEGVWAIPYSYLKPATKEEKLKISLLKLKGANENN